MTIIKGDKLDKNTKQDINDSYFFFLSFFLCFFFSFFFLFTFFFFFFLLFLSSWTASNLGRHKTSLSLGRLLSSPNSYLPSYLLFLHLRAINNTQSWLRVKMA